MSRLYDIIIPIYNASEYVKECLRTVLLNTDDRHHVIAIDDCSPDPQIQSILKSFSAKNYTHLKNENNVGFIKTVNMGMMLSRNDVVLVNSDTVIPQGWLETLDECLSSDDKIGIATPLSNNATIFSVPCFNQPNDLPEGWTVDEFAKLIYNASQRFYPDVPTGVGFCMGIKRKVIDDIGLIDERFGMGYSDECDYAMRAKEAGYRVVCCDNGFVFHHGEKSFSINSTLLRKQNHAKLVEKWPGYEFINHDFCNNNPLRGIQEKIISKTKPNGKKRILEVIHSWDVAAGTELHTKQVIDNNKDVFDFTVAVPSTKVREYLDLEDQQGNPRVIRLRKPQQQLTILGNGIELRNQHIEEKFDQLLQGDYDIVHFQHLIGWGSLNLPLQAKRAGAKVILTIHDYFWMCPEYNLLLPDNQMCGMSNCQASSPKCVNCLQAKTQVPDIKPYINARTKLVQEVMDAADAIIVPSEFVAGMVHRAFKKKAVVVPHGVDINCKISRTRNVNKLKVGFLGNFCTQKGADIFLTLANMFSYNEEYSFCTIGAVDPKYDKAIDMLNIQRKGKYTLQSLPGMLIDVDVLVILSLWDETFCLTLTEAQALGMPVIATKVGAIQDRVIHEKTGYLVDHRDVGQMAELIRRIRADGSLEQIKENLMKQKTYSIKENCMEYRRIYSEVSK